MQLSSNAERSFSDEFEKYAFPILFHIIFNASCMVFHIEKASKEMNLFGLEKGFIVIPPADPPPIQGKVIF